MNKLTYAAVCLCGSLAFQAVKADEDKGAYAGAGIGEVNVKIDDFDDLTTTIDRYDADDTAYKLFVGWRYNPYFATELDYINLGRPSAAVLPGVVARARIDGFAPTVVGTLPLGPLELFAKAGYLFYNFKAEAASPLGTVVRNDSGERFTYGAGLGVTLLKRLNLRLEYETMDIKRVDDLHSLWLTAALRF